MKVKFIILQILIIKVIFFLYYYLLAGQPRRISDYPDCYAGWNYIASIGSMVSLISSFLFIYIVYRQFADKIKMGEKDTLLLPEYFNYGGGKKILKIKSEQFEFNVSIPPKYHTFNELPVTYSAQAL